MIQPTDVDSAYHALKVAQERLLQTGETLANARLCYDLAEAQRLLAGVEGKNEAERKARLYVELRTELSLLADAEQEMRQARCGFEQAQAEVERIRALLRLQECLSRRLTEEGPAVP